MKPNNAVQAKKPQKDKHSRAAFEIDITELEQKGFVVTGFDEPSDAARIINISMKRTGSRWGDNVSESIHDLVGLANAEDTLTEEQCHMLYARLWDNVEHAVIIAEIMNNTGG